MKEANNEIYTKVDEKFIAEFDKNHLSFMKNYYYGFYKRYCNSISRKPLSKKDFYTNMHYRRIQLYQLCCPYCGSIVTILSDKRMSESGTYNYCFNCGKEYVVELIKNKAAKFYSLLTTIEVGLEKRKEVFPDTDEWILAYEFYQVEIVELASIIEVVFRDYFEALLFVEKNGLDDQFIKKIIQKYTGNDFMNIEKASNDYKKAFGIDLKNILDVEVWMTLEDIVNLRNMIVHNNGRIDARFKTTKTFSRNKTNIVGDLYKLDKDTIMKYFANLIIAMADISNIFLNRYKASVNSTIANYYFNNKMQQPQQ
jgi:hypothetical protein